MNAEKFFLEINTLSENYFFKILMAIIILIIGWWLSGKLVITISKAMQKAKIDPGIISFSKSILKILFRIFIILSILSTLQVNVTPIIATLGAAFVAVGIALKDSLSNVAGGVVIIVNKPFKVGDYLELDKFSGTVKSIEIMFTTLITPDNRELIIPNAKLTSDNIINCSKQKNRRLDLIYSINNIAEFEKIKEIFQKVILQNNKILQKPESKIKISKYTGKEIELTISIWCKNNDYNVLKEEFHETVKSEFEKTGVSI